MELKHILIGSGVAFILYQIYKKNKSASEPFVLEDDVKTSNASGAGAAKSAGRCPEGLTWSNTSQSCTASWRT